MIPAVAAELSQCLPKYELVQAIGSQAQELRIRSGAGLAIRAGRVSELADWVD